jgi:hypothetical protein
VLGGFVVALVGVDLGHVLEGVPLPGQVPGGAEPRRRLLVAGKGGGVAAFEAVGEGKAGQS